MNPGYLLIGCLTIDKQSTEICDLLLCCSMDFACQAFAADIVVVLATPPRLSEIDVENRWELIQGDERVVR